MGKKDYIIQSGVVPWLIQDNQLMIVLITARKPVCKWILPKGHIEKALQPELSAANEAYEEAGIKGEISSDIIGSLTHTKQGQKINVSYYPMRVTEIFDDWAKKSERERKIVDINQACDMVTDKKLKRIIKKISGLWQKK